MGTGRHTGAEALLEGCRLVERGFTDEDLEQLARSDRRSLRQRTTRGACAAKHRLGARGARRAARCLRERGELVHAYACDSCGGWHVGHDAVAHVPSPTSARGDAYLRARDHGAAPRRTGGTTTMVGDDVPPMPDARDRSLARGDARDARRRPDA